MRLPRISVLTLMAIVVVVALNGMAFRSIAARPFFVSRRVLLAALVSLPMANVLALAAATRSRRRGSGLVFLLGFEVTGWSVVGATIVWLDPLRELAEAGFIFVGLIPWMVVTPAREAIVIFGAFPGVFLVIQMIVATLGGLVARLIWYDPTLSFAVETSSRRSNLGPLAWLVLCVAIPVGAYETYLRMKVDPSLLDPEIPRLGKGSLAVVDFKVARFPWVPPKATPLATLENVRVSIVSDSAPKWIERFRTSDPNVTVLHDIRPVQVILLDGDRKGGSASVPFCVLRLVP